MSNEHLTEEYRGLMEMAYERGYVAALADVQTSFSPMLLMELMAGRLRTKPCPYARPGTAPEGSGSPQTGKPTPGSGGTPVPASGPQGAK